MSPAPVMIKISEIPAWIEREYGISPPPTRQTIYNWTKHGKKGRLLPVASKFGQLYVAERWLHEFASDL
jgi:hypothetical protein